MRQQSQMYVFGFAACDDSQGEDSGRDNKQILLNEKSLTCVTCPSRAIHPNPPLEIVRRDVECAGEVETKAGRRARNKRDSASSENRGSMHKRAHVPDTNRSCQRAVKERSVCRNLRPQPGLRCLKSVMVVSGLWSLSRLVTR